MSYGQSRSGVVGSSRFIRNRLDRHKKAMSDKLMFLMWEVIAVAIVVLILMVAVRGIANSTTYWKKYHSADLATMSDLALTDQGNFEVNYNLKELRLNWFTKMLMMDELKLQVFLKDGSYSIYDKSPDNDKYPQNFVFAKNKDIEIHEADTSSDYLTLKKKGGTFSIDSSTIIISCPNVDTKKDMNDLKFEVINLDSSLASTVAYMNSALSIDLGNKGDTKDVMIALTAIDKKSATSESDAIIYYNHDSTEKSEKLACLIRKKLYDNDLKITIIGREYDDSKESSKDFVEKRKDYPQWVLIRYYPQDITDDVLSKAITAALKEYYG